MGILAGIAWTVLAIVFAAIVALTALRVSDQRNAETVWKSLWAVSKQDMMEFDPAMVDGLPEPARRYFL